MEQRHTEAETQCVAAKAEVEQLTTQIANLQEATQAAEMVREEMVNQNEDERTSMLNAIQESQHKTSSLLDEVSQFKSEASATATQHQETIAEHEEMAANLKNDLEEAQIKREGLEAQLVDMTSASSSLTSESKDTIANLASEASMLRSRFKQLEVSKAKLDTQLSQEREALASTKLALENATAGASQSSMLDLEIADYKRTVLSLNTRIKDIDEQLAHQREVANDKETQLTSLKTQLEHAEAINKQEDQSRLKLKTLLLKATKDAKERKNRTASLETSERALRVQLESKTQEVETLKIELTQLNVSLNTIEAEQSDKDTTKDVEVHRLKFELESAKRDLKKSQVVLAEAQKELQNFKARAHTLLKQQKEETQPSSDALATVTSELEEKEKALKQAESELEEARTMYKNLEDDYDELNESNATTEETVKKLREQTESRGREYQLARNALEQEQMETINQLRMEHSITLKGQKDRYTKQTAEVEKARVVLSEELQLLKPQMLRTQGSNESANPNDTTSSQPPPSKPTMSTLTPPILNTETLTQSRSKLIEPTGSIGSKASPRSSSGIPDSAAKVVDLATLLVSQVDPGFNAEDASADIELATKRIGHLSTLLAESESTCERLAQQSQVLKQEIRRQEKNSSREEGANLEYLKNVIFKFITAQEEREHLIPALGMLLHFTKDELADATKGFTRNQVALQQAAEKAAASDGFFFPRW